MHVKFFDGTKVNVTDRQTAVDVIKQDLLQWMNPTDRITWDWTSPELQAAGEKPNVAFVVDEQGQFTDAHAVIIS